MNKTAQAIIAFIVVLITTGILWFVNRPVIVKKVTMADVIREAQSGNYKLIDLDTLWQRYSQFSEDALLVDTRQEWEYRSGHIKGSINFPIEPTWWARWYKKSELKEFLCPDKSQFIVFL
ncbi:rhodanese-like domain-containing protein [bacterium]|nr:rhodanese-like domain-containing protein [bacterium]